MVAAHPYISDYHWQILLPDEFTALPLERAPGAIYGCEKRVCFQAVSEPQAMLSWELIPHSPFDEETACRFMSLLDSGNPVDLRVLHRVITLISPVPEAISTAEVVALDCGELAVEILESPQLHVTTCQFVFPSRHHRRWPVHKMTTVLQAYRDPFEKGVIFGRRHEIVSFKNDGVEASTTGEPDRFERIVFSAPDQVFHELLPQVRQAVRTFNFKIEESAADVAAPGCVSMVKILSRRTPPPPQPFKPV